MKLPSKLLPENVPVTTDLGSTDGVSGVLLLMSLFTTMKTPLSDSSSTKEVVSKDPLTIALQIPTLTEVSSTHTINKRSVNAEISRHLSTSGVRVRLSGEMGEYLHLVNGSIQIRMDGSHNSTACMRKHLFQVPIPEAGETIVLESRLGGEFLTHLATGDVEIHSDSAENVESIEMTDDRFFQIFKLTQTNMFYIKHLHTGRYLSVENNSVLSVSQEDFDCMDPSVQFTIFGCDPPTS